MSSRATVIETGKETGRLIVETESTSKNNVWKSTIFERSGSIVWTTVTTAATINVGHAVAVQLTEETLLEDANV